MKLKVTYILAAVLSLHFGIEATRAADITADPVAAPVGEIVTVTVPQARAAAISDVASVIVFAHRPVADKPGSLSIFGIDAQGKPVETPAVPPPAPPAAAAAPAPPAAAVAAAPLPPTPLYTVELPRSAPLAAFPNSATFLLFHPKLPLLYVWQDIAGPAMGSAAANPIFKEFDHLLIYSFAPGQPPKLELATARGPDFMYAVPFAMMSLDAQARRLMLPNLRAPNAPDTDAATGAIGFLKLDERGMPVKEGEKLAITAEMPTAYAGIPVATGAVFVSDTISIFGSTFGPATWDRGSRRARFGSYQIGGVNQNTFRLIGHPTLPLVYLCGAGQSVVFKMEHADGYLTMQPQRLTMNRAIITTPPIVMTKQGMIAFGASNAAVGGCRVFTAKLDNDGNFALPVNEIALPGPIGLEALTYSEKFGRLYAGVEKAP